MSQKEEPSLLDYARFHELAIDHRAIDLFELVPPLIENHGIDLDNAPTASRFTLHDNVEYSEKIQSSKAVLEFLASVLKPPPKPLWDAYLPDRYRIQHMRQELPLLGTDNELDLREFGRKRILPDLSEVELTPCKTDEEKDGGLTWPARYHDLYDTLLARVGSEKLDTTRKALQLVQSSMRDEYTQDVERALMDSVLHKKNKALQPITPPLLPQDPKPLPFVPPSPILGPELVSDKTSLDIVKREELERTLLKHDRIELPHPGPNGELSQESMLLDYAEHGLPASDIKETKLSLMTQWSPQMERPSAERLKTEVPLMPMPLQQKDETGAEENCSKPPPRQVLPTFSRTSVKQPEDFSDLLDDDFLGEMAHLASQKIEEQLEQENLRTVEIMAVEVPALESTMPDKHRKALDISLMKDSLLRRTFAMDPKSERNLPWTPFPSELASVKFDGAPDPCEDAYLTNTLSEFRSKIVIKSQDLLWKPDGLRILHGEDNTDDEKLQIAGFDLGNRRERDLLSRLEEGKALPKSLGRQVTDLSALGESSHLENVQPNLTAPKTRPSSSIPLKREASPILHPQPKALKDPRQARSQCTFSAVSSLASFMATRKQDKHAPTGSQYFAAASAQEVCQTVRQGVARLPRTQQATVQVPASPVLKEVHVPTLPHPPTSGSCQQTIIVNSSLLKTHRGLVRRFENSKALNVIYRDFDGRSGIRSNEDADIIISPTTALILTTLQATTQASLPGHRPFDSLVRDRIARLVSQYDKLLVLLSYTAPQPTLTALSVSDAAAVNSVVAFCACFNGSVNTVLLPATTNLSLTDRNSPLQPSVSANESYMEDWVLGLMSKHVFLPLGDAPLTLLQDETLWELFLRRLGMNAYAAQAVLSMLKAGPDAQAAVVWGLRAFVCMGDEERVRRFAGVVGERMVHCINDQINSRWSF